MITTEQKIENAIKWIKGLKYTKLPQANGSLGDRESGFCCLGYGCSRLNIDYDPNNGDSDEFQKQVGLLTTTGRFSSNFDIEYINGWGNFRFSNSLVSLNDDANYSFRKISTVLINHPEKIFEEEVAKGIKEYFKKN